MKLLMCTRTAICVPLTYPTYVSHASNALVIRAVYRYVQNLDRCSKLLEKRNRCGQQITKYLSSFVAHCANVWYLRSLLVYLELSYSHTTDFASLSFHIRNRGRDESKFGSSPCL